MRLDFCKGQKNVSRTDPVHDEQAHRHLVPASKAFPRSRTLSGRLGLGGIICCVLSLFSSCKQEGSQFSKVPKIALTEVEQRKLNGKDSLVNITFHYEDGDGDIGLNAGDTMDPFNFGSKYFYNLFVNVYRVDNGIATRVTAPAFPPNPPDTINYNDRIANLTPTGKSKSISGDISLFIKALPYPGVTPDSMFYTIQIYDRSLNASNILRTNTMYFQF